MTTQAETQKTHATSEHSTAHLTTTTAPIAETAKLDGVKGDIAKTASHHAEVNRIADHIIPPEKKGDADVALRQPETKTGEIKIDPKETDKGEETSVRKQFTEVKETVCPKGGGPCGCSDKLLAANAAVAVERGGFDLLDVAQQNVEAKNPAVNAAVVREQTKAEDAKDKGTEKIITKEFLEVKETVCPKGGGSCGCSDKLLAANAVVAVERGGFDLMDIAAAAPPPATTSSPPIPHIPATQTMRGEPPSIKLVA